MIELYDTTLRDGDQSVDVNFTLDDKLKITKILSDFGFDFIEGGWPGASHIDTEYFKRVKDLKIKSKISAFSMTSKTPEPENCANIKNILEADPDVFTIVGKTRKSEIRQVLKKEPEEYLKIIKKTIDFLKDTGKKVFYDAEHFFDAFKENKEYLMKALNSSSDADVVVLCDTNGSSFPSEISEIIDKIAKEFSFRIGIHCHNDKGHALSNSIEAVGKGCDHVQGTVNGIGERCGNLDFCSFIPNLYERGLINKKIEINQLTKLSYSVSRIAQIKRNPSAPFVGENAFAHKGGMHSDAMKKSKGTYEHIDPSLVGNKRNYPLSKQSGRSSIIHNLSKYGINADKKDSRVSELVKLVKKKAFLGDAQFYIMASKYFNEITGFEPFKVLDFKIIQKKGKYPLAKIQVEIGNEKYEETEEGDGPLNAFDNSLKKILRKKYPEIDNVKLLDYYPYAAGGTEAAVKIGIKFTDGKNEWSSKVLCTNIIEGSIIALVEAYKYYLKRNMRCLNEI